MKVLVMGLPGSGKTYLSERLVPLINAAWYNADYKIWIDTIDKGRFEDTNKIFVKPTKYDFKVTSKNAKFWAPKIATDFKLKFKS